MNSARKEKTNFGKRQNYFASQYHLQETIGSGGGSEVYRATDDKDAEVAVKILEKVKDVKIEEEMFESEKVNLNILKGTEGVLQIVDHGKALRKRKMKKYIVTELIEGVELYDYLQKGGRLSVAQAKYYFNSLFRTMAKVHQKGIVHRDIKLENILVRQNGEPVLIDFGFAAPLQGNSEGGYFDNQICGTKSYMAPELHKNMKYKGT